MHHYHKLQEIIGKHPVGAPKSEEFLEILKILFPPEDAELAVLLDFKLHKASELAKQAGIAPEEIMRRLEEMADKGTVLAKKMEGESAYALLPNYPGLFEYPVMKGLEEPVRKRLAELWHAYWMKDMAAELARANPPWNRVIPVEDAIPEDIEILPFEVASHLLAKNEAIALADCPCRVLGRNCDKPLNVCLVFDGAARFLSERGMAKLISPQEARDVLRKAEDAALVHTGSNVADRLLFLCNCCPCCCHFLMLLTKREAARGLAKSSYRSVLSIEDCIGCGVCKDRCPVGAFVMEEEVAQLDAEKCIGCGLCLSRCPTSAINLVKRDGYAMPPANAGELVKKIVAHKIMTAF